MSKILRETRNVQYFLTEREEEHSFLSQRKTCNVRELTSVELPILSLKVCGCACVGLVWFGFSSSKLAGCLHNVHLTFVYEQEPPVLRTALKFHLQSSSI